MVGIINTDGAPVQEAALCALADVDPYRWSTDIRSRIDGPVGLGFVPLPTSPVEADGRQPCSLDDRLWAVMDGRLDDRHALATALGAERQHLHLAQAPDVELLLHAYDVWGADCVAHLLGDFAFVLWDARQRRLLCARDHFGVKPVYYARVGNTLVVSNVLRSVRRHPAVSARLSDAAIGDFLLFGFCVEEATTPFADVSRLPPAHRLLYSSSSGLHRVERYWTLQPGELTRHRDPREYVERFSCLLRVAVADRLRDDQVGILMSGGLDSSSVAAVATDVLGRARAAERLRAYTAVYDTSIPDEERHYSSIVARSLDIGIEHLPADAYGPFARWDGDALPPEPSTEVLTALMADLLDRMSGHGPAALTGDGGDPILLPSTVVSQLGRVPILELATDLWRSVRRVRACPPLGVRSRIRAWLESRSRVPAWLADSLLAAYDPHARWEEIRARQTDASIARHRAVNEVLDPWWASTFESMDPGATQRPVELRYPFYDVRLVSYAVTLPSYPWCLDKEILRTAMQGRLPESIRVRPKTPLAGDPFASNQRWSLAAAIRLLETTPAMAQYVDSRRFESTVHSDDMLADEEPGTLAAMGLATWLRCSEARGT